MWARQRTPRSPKRYQRDAKSAKTNHKDIKKEAKGNPRRVKRMPRDTKQPKTKPKGCVKEAKRNQKEIKRRQRGEKGRAKRQKAGHVLADTSTLAKQPFLQNHSPLFALVRMCCLSLIVCFVSFCSREFFQYQLLFTIVKIHAYRNIDNSQTNCAKRFSNNCHTSWSNALCYQRHRNQTAMEKTILKHPKIVLVLS